MTAIKVAVVVLVVVVGSFYIKAANYAPFIPPGETGKGNDGSGVNQSVFSLLTGAQSSHYGWYGLLAGASIVFFAFIGFDVVATTAEETKNPQRDVARGILASLAIVTLLYVAVSVVLSGMVSYTELASGNGHAQANLATAFSINGVNWAAKVISVGALAGLTTVVMVLVLGQSRVLFAMSRDGLLPRGLARTGSHGTPVRITVIVAVLIAVAATIFPIGKLEEMVNVGTLFAFVVSHVIVALPFTIISIINSLKLFDQSIEDAAVICGASRLQAVFRVTFPAIRPGMVAGALFAFLVSWDEVVLSVMMASPTLQTLPVKMWTTLRQDLSPVIAVASTLLIGLSLLVMFIAAALRRRTETNA